MTGDMVRCDHGIIRIISSHVGYLKQNSITRIWNKRSKLRNWTSTAGLLLRCEFLEIYYDLQLSLAGTTYRLTYIAKQRS